MNPTVQAEVFGEDHPFTINRKKQIEEIIASGKAVRFTYPIGFHKDVKEFAFDTEANPIGDMMAFRQTGEATHFVCWESPTLAIEAVDI